MKEHQIAFIEAREGGTVRFSVFVSWSNPCGHSFHSRNSGSMGRAPDVSLTCVPAIAAVKVEAGISVFWALQANPTSEHSHLI